MIKPQGESYYHSYLEQLILLLQKLDELLENAVKIVELRNDHPQVSCLLNSNTIDSSLGVENENRQGLPSDAIQ